MGDDKHLWITFNPAKGDPREIIIDQGENYEHGDMRVCDGQTVVKVRFSGPRIKDVLQDDVFLGRVIPLNIIYDGVERVLSHSLQPDVSHEEAHKEVETARNALRAIMLKMGWKGQF